MLEHGLNEIGCACTNQEAKLLIERYDADGDGKLSFWEFANMFMPIDEKLRQELETRKNTPDLGDSGDLVRKLLFR